MKKVLLVVPDGSEDMEVAAFVEIPGWTKVVNVEQVEVTVAGWGDKIKMYHGLTIIPDIKINEVNIDEYDALAIPGGWPGTRYNEQCYGELMLDIVKKTYSQNKLIATMCFGIIALGEAGHLKGVKATSFTSDDGSCETCKKVKAKVISYGTDFQEKAIVVDRNVIFNIGPAVADEVALKMVELLIGEEATQSIVDMIMYAEVEPQELKWTGPVSKKDHKKLIPSAGTGCCRG